MRHKFIVFLAAFICIYTIFLSAAIYLQYNSFTPIQDFSDYLLVISNTSRGDIFGSTIFWCLEAEKINLLSGHLSPVLLLYAVIYRIINNPILLFIIQIFAVALTALPIFYIAKARLKYEPAAFIIALSFLLYQPAMSAAATSLQPETLSMPLIAMAFLSLVKYRYRWCVFFLILLLLLKENLAFVVSTFGLFIFFKANKKIGLGLFILGLLWFTVFSNIIAPLFQHGNITRIHHWYGHLGNNLAEILKNLILSPITSIKKGLAPYWDLKRSMQWQMLFPLLYLPLLAPQVLFIALPVIAQIYLSRNHFMPYYLCYYHASIDPLLFIAAIYGLERLFIRKAKAGKSFALLSVCIIIFLINLYIAVFRSQFFTIKKENRRISISRMPIYTANARDRFIWGVIKEFRIPQDASIATTFPYDQVFITQRRCTLIPYYKHDCPDYIFLDALNDVFGESYRLSCAYYLGEVLNDPWYEPVFENAGLYIFKRKPLLPSGDFLEELNNFSLRMQLRPLVFSGITADGFIQQVQEACLEQSKAINDLSIRIKSHNRDTAVYKKKFLSGNVPFFKTRIEAESGQWQMLYIYDGDYLWCIDRIFSCVEKQKNKYSGKGLYFPALLKPKLSGMEYLNGEPVYILEAEDVFGAFGARVKKMKEKELAPVPGRIWVDAKRWVILKIELRYAPEKQVLIYYNDYRKFYGKWVAYRIEYYTAGSSGKELFLTEEVTEVKVNAGLEDALFDLKKEIDSLAGFKRVFLRNLETGTLSSEGGVDEGIFN